LHHCFFESVSAQREAAIAAAWIADAAKQQARSLRGTKQALHAQDADEEEEAVVEDDDAVKISGGIELLADESSSLAMDASDGAADAEDAVNDDAEDDDEEEDEVEDEDDEHQSERIAAAAQAKAGAEAAEVAAAARAELAVRVRRVLVTRILPQVRSQSTVKLSFRTRWSSQKSLAHRPELA
jgi:hypothetical protein